MKRDIAALADGTFDLLIIGGGITGAGVARDAAMRGLRVALVEQADFASGTSSKSTKLIHGGFRYLEQYAFGLVAEACRERRILQDIAPHLVHPVQFILPVYRGDPRSLFKMRIGMTLYDLLARYHNTAVHRTLSATETAIAEPALDRQGLRGAIAFYDCQEDDAQLCVDTIHHAADLGAQCANYCRVNKLVVQGGRVVTAQVTDLIGSTQFEIRAKIFLNATGPWAEGISAMGPGGPQVKLSRTKGAHILLPRLTQNHGIFFQSRRDNRMIFIIPWHDCTLVGTTDTDYSGAPEDVRVDEQDITYLLEEARTILPEKAIQRSDVIATFAGVRPLLGSDQAQPSARSREHKLSRQGDNLLTIAGGKYTTYRAVAAEAVERIFVILGAKAPRCRTATSPIPDLRPPPRGEKLSELPEIFDSNVCFACQQQMATSVSDVMWRRTGLALSRYGGADVAGRVAEILAHELGWTNTEKGKSLSEYLSLRPAVARIRET